MSIMKFLRILLNESGMDGMYQFAPGERHVELVAAQSQVASLIAAYDALAPKPDAWWDNAQWFVIDPNGDCFWFHDEPKANEWRWTNDDWFRDVGYEKGRRVNIPLGVDWRLLKWQRPEVAA
jgi:hypothetical protein